MQHHISTTTFHHVRIPAHSLDQTVDHPERMMFYAVIGSLLTWSVIGMIGWGFWALL